MLRENLNTLIINLYPGNKGYSLAFRRGTEQTNDGGRNVSTKILVPLKSPDAIANNNFLFDFKISKSGAISSDRAGSPSMGAPATMDINSEQLQETIRWPYEEEELLECIDREEIPLVLVDMFESKCPGLFYSGCVIAEVRDYRQSFPIFTCDTYHVLLKPTNQVGIVYTISMTFRGKVQTIYQYKFDIADSTG